MARSKYPMSDTKQILDSAALRLVISRIAHEIEENIAGKDTIVIGIQQVVSIRTTS